MQIIHRLSALRDRLKFIRANGGTVALVPTMGALHDGHMTLVKAARQQADHVIVSIFVNPRQFGPNEDFAAYPRPADADAERLVNGDVDLLWMPRVEDMYPAGYATTIAVAGLGDGLCGTARPGHFDGVATVVCKLFTQVRPDTALFGEKDWQQLAIIRRMTLDLDLGVDVIGVETARDPDGLALSSRNAYLTKAQRQAAVALPKALKSGVTGIEAGADVATELNKIRAAVVAAGFDAPDYVTLAGAEDLQPMTELDRPARLFIAARLGRARLIDNRPVDPARMRKVKMR